MSSAHYSVAAAILEINNNAVFVCYGDNPNSIEWLDGTTPISVSDIVSKQAELKTAYDNNDYQRSRANEYPSMADQLDDIYHNGVDEWKKTIKAVKDKYPKPS